jgi:hypothetical protein
MRVICRCLFVLFRLLTWEFLARAALFFAPERAALTAEETFLGLGLTSFFAVLATPQTFVTTAGGLYTTGQVAVQLGILSLLADPLGSTIALSDSSGAIQMQYTYEPFGKTTEDFGFDQSEF